MVENSSEYRLGRQSESMPVHPRRVYLFTMRFYVALFCLIVLSSSVEAQINYQFKYAIGGTINNPVGLAIDAADNLYVADTGNNRVVKFDMFNSFLGKIGKKGTANAQFSSPTAVAVDGYGNIYVADSSNNRIQKFKANGSWAWTVGGYGTANAKFNHPMSVGVDGPGNNVYVADTNNNRIQRFDGNGNYLSQFGTKGNGNSQLLSPACVAVDSLGNIDVLDTGNNALKQFDTMGNLNWIAGGLNTPQGLTFDPNTGYIDVADTGNRRVVQYYSNGSPTGLQVGSNGDGNGQFRGPYGVAVDSSGDMFVTDFSSYYGTNRIQKFDSQGNYLDQFGASGYIFNNPTGVAIDNNGTLSVADTGGHRVQQIDNQGNLRTFGSYGDGNGQFRGPYGVAVASSGDIFVTDFNSYYGTNRVQKFDDQGNYLNQFGSGGSGNGRFSFPAGVALDGAGNIYVADADNHRIQVFDKNFTFLSSFGSQGTSNGLFQYPTGVAVDSAGYIYVADSSNNRIQKFNSSGKFAWAVGGYGKGVAQFQLPYSIAVDASNNVYVTDTKNNRVQKFDTNGKFLTQFSVDGWGDAYASQVSSLTVDANGTVYVTESTNSRLVVLAAVNAGPTLTSITPSQSTTVSGNITMTVNGTNFTSGSTANFAGTALATTFVSVMQLTAIIPASLLTTTGNYNITVTNPAGGGTSNALTFSVSNPLPSIASLSPNQAALNSADTLVTINGANFIPSSAVKFGTTSLKVTYVSATQLTATLPAALLTKAGGYAITVVNVSPGGGTSNVVNFTVGSNPLPVITGITPNRLNAGSVAVPLTVSGKSFLNGATIKFGSTILATTFVAATQLTASIPASLLSAPGKFSVSVNNPKPGGGNSNILLLSVVNPTPVLTGITPAQAMAGASDTTINLAGSGFTAASKAQFNGVNLVTTFVSSTKLTAVIPASQLATPGAYDVAVYNPGPGGGTSAGYDFSVFSPAPTLTSISPNQAKAGAKDIPITLTGSNFVNGATVTFGGVSLVTTYVSSTQLTAIVPASQLTTAGAYDVVVNNPGPGGGDTAPVTFTVTP